MFRGTRYPRISIRTAPSPSDDPRPANAGTTGGSGPWILQANLDSRCRARKNSRSFQGLNLPGRRGGGGLAWRLVYCPGQGLKPATPAQPRGGRGWRFASFRDARKRAIGNAGEPNSSSTQPEVPSRLLGSIVRASGAARGNEGICPDQYGRICSHAPRGRRGAAGRLLYGVRVSGGGRRRRRWKGNGFAKGSAGGRCADVSEIAAVTAEGEGPAPRWPRRGTLRARSGGARCCLTRVSCPAGRKPAEGVFSLFRRGYRRARRRNLPAAFVAAGFTPWQNRRAATATGGGGLYYAHRRVAFGACSTSQPLDRPCTDAAGTARRSWVRKVRRGKWPGPLPGDLRAA
jgi:hypothetical protein